MPYKFEISKDKNEKFRFNFVAPNGEIMMSSQAYGTKAAAKKTIASLQKNVGGAEVTEKES